MALLHSMVSAAGVHVWSRVYKVAALGNIATRPDQKGRGPARAVAARPCRELLPEVDHVGLNVRAHNRAALACYTGPGFAPVADYEERLCRRS